MVIHMNQCQYGPNNLMNVVKNIYMKLDVHVKHWTSTVTQSYEGLITR